MHDVTQRHAGDSLTNGEGGDSRSSFYRNTLEDLKDQYKAAYEDCKNCNVPDVSTAITTSGLCKGINYPFMSTVKSVQPQLHIVWPIALFMSNLSCHQCKFFLTGIVSKYLISFAVPTLRAIPNTS